MRHLRPLLAAVALVLLLAPPALAEERSAEAAAGGMEGRIAGGLRDGGRQYLMRGHRLALNGRVAAADSGATVRAEIFRSGQLVDTIRVAVGARGRFSVSLPAASTGRHTVRATLERAAGESAEGAPSVTSTARVIHPRARRGGRGLGVRLLQRGLARLGFVTSRSGRYDDATRRAVLAFRKTNGMRRTTGANQAIFSKLFQRRGGYRLRYPRAGKHVEYDWSRQVLVLARGGRPVRVYHSSSGAPSTPTVFGRFRFYRRQWGTNAKGMVHSLYFIRGYAIHGFKSVPTYPASHGCLRVPIPNARSIARWISLGDRIYVYR